MRTHLADGLPQLARGPIHLGGRVRRSARGGLAGGDHRHGGERLLSNCGLFGDFAMAVASALGTVLVLGLLLALSRRVSAVTLLVAEPVLGYLFTGLISVVMHFVDESQARAFASCSDRSLAGATFQQLHVFFPLVAVGLVLAWLHVKPLNSSLLDEMFTRSLGLSVERTRHFTFLVLLKPLTAERREFTGFEQVPPPSARELGCGVGAMCIVRFFWKARRIGPLVVHLRPPAGFPWLGVRGNP